MLPFGRRDKLIKKIANWIESDTKLFTFYDIPLIISKYLKIYFLSLFCFGMILSALIAFKDLNEASFVVSSVFICLIALVVLIYPIVVIHEYGHSLMAKKLGATTGNIILHPLGGAAFVNFYPYSAKKEFLIVAAGPITNIFFCLISYPFSSNVFVSLFFNLNLIMVIFNLIPCFPMDGGRILRSIIVYFNNNELVATKWTVIVSFVVGGISGLFAILFTQYFTAGLILTFFPYMGYLEYISLREKDQLLDEIADIYGGENKQLVKEVFVSLNMDKKQLSSLFDLTISQFAHVFTIINSELELNNKLENLKFYYPSIFASSSEGLS